MGLLTTETAIVGALAGAGALVGNWIGKRTLARIAGPTFERIVHVMLLISGTTIVYRALRS